MAIFTNYATLSYSGGTANSNIVTGEIVETLSAVKTAVVDSYSVGEHVTYVISILNSGTTALAALTLTDDLGGYTFDSTTVYPLSYVDGSVRYYVNGLLQATPTVTAGPPMTVSGINIPAGGNGILIYETDVTAYAPPDAGSTVTNTATVTGAGLTTPVTAAETVSGVNAPLLAISKSVTPSTVAENGQLTYVFVIENNGNTEAVLTDNVVLTDTFDPILTSVSATYNGTAWTEGTNYSYDETTGVFTTLAGQITVPAAEYTQASDGTWSATPGVATVTVTGTI